MEKLLSHQVREGGMVPSRDPNRLIEISRSDACDVYEVLLNPSAHSHQQSTIYLPFHVGCQPCDPPLATGLTFEAMLAVVADRLERFQAGPFACEFNARALDHVRSALALLHARSRERANRGVGPTEV